MAIHPPRNPLTDAHEYERRAKKTYFDCLNARVHLRRSAGLGDRPIWVGTPVLFASNDAFSAARYGPPYTLSVKELSADASPAAVSVPSAIWVSADSSFGGIAKGSPKISAKAATNSSFLRSSRKRGHSR